MFENPPINKYKTKIWYLNNSNEPVEHIAMGTILEIAGLYNTNGVVTTDKVNGKSRWIPPHRIVLVEFEKV